MAAHPTTLSPGDADQPLLPAYGRDCVTELIPAILEPGDDPAVTPLVGPEISEAPVKALEVWPLKKL